ncbi:MAG: hypothetical protein II836_06275 [Clostridia bacterium]|nr:hypothetical protein [Clostridia bacterium]
MHKTRILSLLAGVLIMAVSLLSLFSCAFGTPDGEIVAATLSMGAMRDSYRFALRQTEDGVLFSCDEDDGEGRTVFEDLTVPEALLREFRRAARDTKFDKVVASGRKSHSFGAADKTMWEFTLTWSDGTERTTTVRPAGEEEIRAFLSKAARVFAVTEEEAGPLNSLSLSAAASWIEGCYVFEIRESKGETCMDARFTDLLNNEDNGEWDVREIDLNNAVLTAEQMERIRAAAHNIGLWNMLAADEIRWEDPNADDDDDLIPLDATTYSLSARWGKTIRSDSGWGDPDYGELMTVLREIAREIAP